MTVRVLNSSPSMLPLFGRAGLAMIPGASRLPLVGVGGGGGDIPELTLVLKDVSADRDRIASYDQVCAFDVGDRLPPTYPHMLAFPLHLALMTDGSFPFPAIGLVHVYNRIAQHRAILASETLSLTVSAGPLQPHPAGRQFSILTEARVSEELVWEEVSTNLRRGNGTAGAPVAAVPDAGEVTASATWTLPGDLGRRYGSVSGDLNPIHVHSLTARLFGFPSAIAHGMWTKARCLAALAPQLPDAFTVEVAFRKPILLPAKVEFAQEQSADGSEIRFGVRDASKGGRHLSGRVTLG